ncbi:1,2-phenylacetyl-CoA epoxidase subunit PaaE [Calidifontibacter terrae]
MTVQLTTPARRRSQFHDLRVVDVQRLTPTSVAVTFAVPPELAADFAFTPGQHLTLRATIDGQDARRSYSICITRSEALRRGAIRVGSSKVDGGLMSTWLNEQVQPGDVVQVMTPLGSFTTPPSQVAHRHHVAFAAGSGITPVLSILGSLLDEDPAATASLVYGNRRTDSVMFLEELADLKNAHPSRFQLFHVLSREPQDVEWLNGRIDAEKIKLLLGSVLPVSTVDEWYLCGPFQMVESARKVLADNGVSDDHVHHEIFHVDDGTTPAKRVEIDTSAPAEAVVTVNLDGRTTRVEMPSKAETILDATLRARPDAPFSCTGGVCGTCRARVVRGEVTMDRNYALEPDEVAAGIVLACQSHPVTDEVELDYDA